MKRAHVAQLQALQDAAPEIERWSSGLEVHALRAILGRCGYPDFQADSLRALAQLRAAALRVMRTPLEADNTEALHLLDGTVRAACEPLSGSKPITDDVVAEARALAQMVVAGVAIRPRDLQRLSAAVDAHERKGGGG
jgi:hypothetical protein